MVDRWPWEPIQPPAEFPDAPWIEKETNRTVKGSTCTKCGMFFEAGKAYLFSCGNDKCPVQPRPTL